MTCFHGSARGGGLQHPVVIFVSAGKNWDFTAALSDFEQLRQVHAGTLAYSSTEDRAYPLPDKDMARVGRPLLHRQSEVVQGAVVSACQFYGCGCVRTGFNRLRAAFLQLRPKNAFRGAFPTQVQPSCPWRALTSPTPGAPVASLCWTCRSARSSCPTSPCTGRTSAASSRGT